MLFNSFEYLIFFPVVCILFFAIPHRVRWFLLLIASCIFYMYFIPKYIFILFFTIIIDYIAGLVIEGSHGKKRKAFLILSLVANIGVLCIFKYYNFFVLNIEHISNVNIPLLKFLLPIGLSFHTFQAMSYTIEVYRGNYKAEKHFGIYALYVMFFPQLVAGPIERPQNMLYQFHEKEFFNYDNAVSGFRLIFWGMIKKVVIADRLAQFAGPVFDHPHDYPGITIAMASVFFSFQIFCDFSGYTDIAIGSARVMGFKLMANFNKPYHSRSVSEFWKRWHISLSTWFRDYLYIPLGGNRASLPRVYFNIFFVFLISGLWHGANWTFIVWGALHGFYLLFGQATSHQRNKINVKLGIKKIHWLNNTINVFTVFILVTFAWIFFRASNLHSAFELIAGMKHIPAELSQVMKSQSLSSLKMPMGNKDILLCLGLIFFLEIVHITQVKYDIMRLLDNRPAALRWTLYYAGILLIFFLGVFGSHSFIYFQF
jgi:alginate O-acetyltransferase complex protein AlgI